MIPRYSRKEMSDLWTEEAKYSLWLEIETLALEQMVNLGVAPASALKAVKEKGKFSVERILEIEKEVKHDVIAFLMNVSEHVGEQARYLHLGMTSSDLLDTVLAVQLCRSTDLLLNGLDTLCDAVRSQALKHRDTVCVGRSHGIHAEPTTFGLKVAGWYTELRRQQQRLRLAREEIAYGAISGPVGTFSHLDPSVEEFVCKRLGLKPEPVSTQVIPRDRHANLFLRFAELGGSLERICVEVRHLQRTEVREVEEDFTKGQKGSSAMPHKRNPILSENVTGLARLLRGWAFSSTENVALWHERDISHSSVERVIAPDMTITLDFMLARVTSIVKNMAVYPKNMLNNLESTRGLVYSAGLLVSLEHKGMEREEAYRLVQKHALETWDSLEDPKAPDFATRIKGDKRVQQFLSGTELADVFSLKKQLEKVGFIFNRAFPEDAEAGRK